MSKKDDSYESTTEVETGGDCCDVCRTPKIPEPKMKDRTEELKVLVSAIDEIGSKGEVKLVQWMCGSHLAWTEKFNTPMAIQKGTLIIGGDNLYVCVMCMD